MPVATVYDLRFFGITGLQGLISAPESTPMVPMSRSDTLLRCLLLISGLSLRSARQPIRIAGSERLERDRPFRIGPSLPGWPPRFRVPSVMRRTLSFWALALTASATGLATNPAEARIGTAADLQVAVRDIQLTPPDFGGKPAVMPLPFTPPAAPATNLRLASVSQGTASWYGPGFYGNRTASGEVFRPGTMTAAHRSLPFGTRVRVTNLNNGRSAVVRINDRGPFHGGRVIDLAQGAAQELGVTSSGVAPVRLEVIR